MKVDLGEERRGKRNCIHKAWRLARAPRECGWWETGPEAPASRADCSCTRGCVFRSGTGPGHRVSSPALPLLMSGPGAPWSHLHGGRPACCNRGPCPVTRGEGGRMDRGKTRKCQDKGKWHLFFYRNTSFLLSSTMEAADRQVL